MRLTINVTDKHIAAGTPLESTECPVARALRSAGFKGSSVWSTGITLYSRKSSFKRGTFEFVDRESVVIRKVPKSLTRFVDAFDDHLPVKPFTFSLNVSRSDLKKLSFKPRLQAA